MLICPSIWSLPHEKGNIPQIDRNLFRFQPSSRLERTGRLMWGVIASGQLRCLAPATRRRRLWLSVIALGNNSLRNHFCGVRDMARATYHVMTEAASTRLIDRPRSSPALRTPVLCPIEIRRRSSGLRPAEGGLERNGWMGSRTTIKELWRPEGPGDLSVLRIE